jgi:hypothetical protein
MKPCKFKVERFRLKVFPEEPPSPFLFLTGGIRGKRVLGDEIGSWNFKFAGDAGLA